MQHKLIIIVEILPYSGQEDTQKVKREFWTNLSPVPRTRLKILTGPPREICNANQVCKIISGQKAFEGFIGANDITYFPEEDTITILFQDSISLLTLGKRKVSDIVAEYKKHQWELVP